MPKMMGFETITEEDCALRETTGVFGHDPDTFTNSVEKSSKKWRAGISLAGNEGRSHHTRNRVSSAVTGTKFEALSN